MFDFHDNGNPLFVLIGIIVAQLFMYGRKVKERVHIAASDVVADLMQFGTMFVVCMGFLALARKVTGWDLSDPWQLVTVVIMFNMSFDTWFNRLRETFNNKVGNAVDVLLGRKIAVEEQPAMPVIDAPKRSPSTEMADEPLRHAYLIPRERDDTVEDLLHRLDTQPGTRDNTDQ